MADSPYFDSAYFDSTYFDVDVATPTTEGRSGKRRHRLTIPPPEPIKETEEWITLIL